MRMFMVNIPNFNIHGHLSKRVYVINPKKVRMIDYSPHFNKIDIRFDNGDHIRLTDLPELETIYNKITTELGHEENVN